MPNNLRLAVPAGTTVVFDTACWHTSLPNLGLAGQGGGLDGLSRCTVQVDYTEAARHHTAGRATSIGVRRRQFRSQRCVGWRLKVNCRYRGGGCSVCRITGLERML